MNNNITEKEITQKIINCFKDKYKIKRSTVTLSNNHNSLEINLKYDFKLFLSVHLVNEPFYYNNQLVPTPSTLNLKFIINGNIYILESGYSNGNAKYLIEVKNVIDDLMNQIKTYEEFIKGFVDSVIDDLHGVEYQINLNTATAYFKSDDNKAIIYPAIEFGHTEKYATMYVNSLTGKYPMKMYSSISYEDAKEMLEFFL